MGPAQCGTPERTGKVLEVHPSTLQSLCQIAMNPPSEIEINANSSQERELVYETAASVVHTVSNVLDRSKNNTYLIPLVQGSRPVIHYSNEC